MAVSSAAAARAETVTIFDQATGMFKVEQDSAELIATAVAFWRKDWSWLHLAVKSEDADGGERRVRWYNSQTRMTVDASVARPTADTMTWRIKLAENPQGDVDTYGAVNFSLTPEAALAVGVTTKPEIRRDRTGWTWDLGGGRPPLSVTFDKPLARLEYEDDKKTEIRAYLVEKNDRADTVEVTMTVTSPGGFAPAPAERVARKSPNWRQNVLHWNRTAVDLSHLNAAEKPAGKRGVLRAEGENFVFADGTKARFWGTNLVAYTLFLTSPPELVRNHAKRLSRLGFNLVRLHHHDSVWVTPNVFDPKSGGTRALNAQALARLDWWIACLKAEGIYVWLDLHVGRQVTAADGVDAFDEISGGQRSGSISGYNYVNASVQERMKEFAGSYLSHVNQHTGLAYKDDPAVMAVMITNENDLTHHYGNGLLPDKNVPWHNKLYMALADQFAARHGLEADKVWRSWEFGPNKLFLADLEHKFNADMTAYLRQLGVKAPIIGTNFWGNMTMSGLPSLAAADFIDVHTYGRANEVQSNPRFKAGMASWIASGAVTGKPLTVSEWNVEPFPVFDRFQVPLRLAAIAGLQGWNGLLQYAYSQSALGAGAGAGNWEAFNDPAFIATMPAAALLYRGGHVREGPVTHSLQLPAGTVIGQDISPVTSRAIRTLTETSRFRVTLPPLPQLAWFKPEIAPSGAKVIDTPDYDAVGPDKTAICSDTGEICRDWKRGVATVDTPKSQIASGWIGGETVSLADVTINISTRNAAVAVQSLDDSPIVTSGQILISVAAQSAPMSADRPVYLTEPVEGRLSIRAKPGLKLSFLDPVGDKKPVNMTRRGYNYDIILNESFASFWGILE